MMEDVHRGGEISGRNEDSEVRGTSEPSEPSELDTRIRMSSICMELMLLFTSGCDSMQELHASVSSAKAD
jgi:hypothetical protein